MLKVTFLASGQFFDRSMFRLINTTYSWIQVILRQISLYRAFHGIAHSYWTRTTYNGHRTGSLIAEDLLNPEVFQGYRIALLRHFCVKGFAVM